jgi:hypothetical protein
LIEADLGQGRKSGRWIICRCPFPVISMAIKPIHEGDNGVTTARLVEVLRAMAHISG